MNEDTLKFILSIVDSGKDLTLATVRPDGYPQATTVSYANDGLTIYVGIGRESQKARNISHSNKVSIAINTEYRDWQHIRGLSMGGLAEIVNDQETISRAAECMIKRFPELADWIKSGPIGDVVFLKITPEVISVLDYQKGFGYTELVRV